ncbi:hypothetical protein O6H91_10G058800 [Diphasiastrum complanatum]|uniref:Uncharacterized protein n=2 Tax=Diphasiastrum complanatum TaxID=34168 RepID=A0ACC2CHB0_DIPCM|nr:hypothetical protein O6H91_10G058800 [Diphasiastrum complanatum]KAJ7541421.1 hypothetical protein O6H91_10G058800 [Diphasiastrum complanatum]
MMAMALWIGLLLLLWLLALAVASHAQTGLWRPVGGLNSILGDPGMRSNSARVGMEGWNFCNGAPQVLPGQPSPRWADCADLLCYDTGNTNCTVNYLVTEQDNQLRTGDPFPTGPFINFNDSTLYAAEKERYLGSLCNVTNIRPNSTEESWQYWMIMLKNGNFDVKSGLCPATSSSIQKPKPLTTLANLASFPCFGSGCMNQPAVLHSWSSPQWRCEPTPDGNCTFTQPQVLRGGFAGTYDINPILNISYQNRSFFSVEWQKNSTTGSWIFSHTLKVSQTYPWLMLYLRADATSGVSGGYPWDGRGMMAMIPKSPDFRVILTLNVIRGGGPQSQFYLLDIGGCWKNNGQPCDGDVKTDVTRYSEMIINPATDNWCTPSRLELCPPYHVSTTGSIIYRNNTLNFPYTAYHLYCSPTNAVHREYPANICDPYSNPQPQELMQLLPHPEWAVHGYPAQKGEGWIGDPRTWELDVGALSNRLYFYQDPGTPAAERVWPSIDVGTEIYISNQDETAEWTVSDFDVLVADPLGA